MTMSALVQKVPKRLGELLGPEGTVEFVDFLNRAFGDNNSTAIDIVTDRFERRLLEEGSKLRSEISELKAEFRFEFSKFRSEFTDLKTEFTDLRTEFTNLKTEFANLKTDFADHRADIKSEVVEIHKSISLQTKWILGVVIGTIGVFSIIVKF
ncbi:hypothetical protein LEP1GSC107_4720 [Leptospira interrogans serovar Grippotyphosa str. UI 12769]|nr:hypothetical protein [Leptospira interrogans]EMF71044.1 hypothetical protein LEP1GSC148_3640 [Leptospira interrogans serovar Canicola str. LT1962]AJR13136.1 hypothetical protein LIL_10534 [Leptospira interrogans serovar Linhai str. 56609]EKO87214.1 hypothetical protein LEP1GSC009_3483 [Leptospira interrogans serovar Grippotyphosa str. Andaman]EKP86219.1 hypothetical protein LEP1GSC020_3546 [Leptospira interrogans serovar Grippotyphosa str. 2006006986]EKR46491.1 hypothetical protein LEP1GSC0